ncbi:lysophospholipid acyltransferase family protein [Salibacterium aidingense]|uniref:lysophospholipid acyltransferase family protein n=1 Tax=Salibacterium aidingense TaxID=384933 RepID=UPI000411C4A1|nr:lysophospholipid acyltransferase family protein [Salibacterium aidingense]
MLYKVLTFVAKIIIPILLNVKFIGRENIAEDEGPFIISSNHISCYDPILLSLLLERKMYFLAKMELCDHWLTNGLFKKLPVIPVDRQSGIVIRPVRKTLRLLKEGEIVGVFPEGTRVPNGEKVMPKKGVAFFAVKSEVPVLPVAITLCEDKYWFRRKAVINIGSPIEVSSFETNDYKELAHDIMQQSRDLIIQQPEDEFGFRKESTQHS